MKKNMKLAETMNTYNPALPGIKRRRHNIKIRLDEGQNEVERWIAQKRGSEVIGFSPLSLLGLVIIAKRYGNDWNEVRTEDWYNKILENDEI